MRTWMCINYLYSIHVLMKLVCAYARSQIKYEFVACGALGIQGQMDLCTLSKRGKYQWLSRKRRKSTQVVMFLRSPELCDAPDGEGETARQCNAQCFSHTSWLRNLHRRVHPVWMLQMIVREWYYITISPLACIYGRMNMASFQFTGKLIIGLIHRVGVQCNNASLKHCVPTSLHGIHKSYHLFIYPVDRCWEDQ